MHGYNCESELEAAWSKFNIGGDEYVSEDELLSTLTFMRMEGVTRELISAFVSQFGTSQEDDGENPRYVLTKHDLFAIFKGEVGSRGKAPTAAVGDEAATANPVAAGRALAVAKGEEM